MKDAHSLDVSESEYDSYRAEMCKFAISGINDDGMELSSVTKAERSKDYSVHNPNIQQFQKRNGDDC